MIYGYIRVSTDKQNIENQKFEINRYCENNNIVINKWIKETISSTKKLEDRKLGKLLKHLKKDDIIIATEISRLGRNLLQIMSILNYCMDIGCQIWTIKDNYKLGIDIQSKVLAFAFGLSAEIERNLISQRTREALTRIKNEGKHLGRNIGSKTNNIKLKDKEILIKSMYIDKHMKKIKIAKMLNVNYSTLYRYMRGRW